MNPLPDLSRVLSDAASLTAAERQAIVEIAWLAVAIDHAVHGAEEDALRRIAAHLLGREGDRTLDALFARGAVLREEADARLRELASLLASPEARAFAYRAAYALALVDLASSDEEFEFDLELIDALGLAQEEADQIATSIIEALTPPG